LARAPSSEGTPGCKARQACTGLLWIRPVIWASQFRATHGVKQWQLVMDHAPKDIVGDVLIVMTKDIPDAGNLLPRDLGMPLLQRIRQPAACLRDDLNAALDDPAFSPIRFESGEGDARKLAADQVDGLNDIKKTDKWRRRRH
jgi:hypothetical protein